MAIHVVCMLYSINYLLNVLNITANQFPKILDYTVHLARRKRPYQDSKHPISLNGELFVFSIYIHN